MRTRVAITFWIAGAMIVGSSCAVGQAEGTTGRLRLVARETLVVKLQTGGVIGGRVLPLASPDNRHVACWNNSDRHGLVMALDGQVAGPTVHGGTLALSPVFSADGTRLAYVAGGGGAGPYSVIVDRVNVTGKQWREIGELVFSQDSKRFAYTARTHKNWRVVVDGSEMQGFDDVTYLQFSPSGDRLAYCAKADGKWFVVLADQQGERFDSVREPVFSPDGQRFAYTAVRGERELVVLDGVPQTVYERIGHSGLIFSPDSRRVAYAALRDGKWHVVVDGVERGEYGTLLSFFYFSPDTTRVLREAYVRGVSSISFSPDSRRVAYPAERGGKWMVVVDGSEGSGFDGVDSAVVFSADSRRVAYVAKTGKRECVVVDGLAGASYEMISDVTFSPDGQHVAYLAKGDKKWFVVVDGVETEQKYDGFLVGSKVIFDTADRLHTIGDRGRDDLVYCLDVELAEGQP